MNKIQEHQVKLLSELDAICVDNEIPYVLYGRTARDACLAGSFIGGYMELTVLMPINYIDEFISCAKKQYGTSRAFENNYDTSTYSSLCIRYIDENTSFIYGDNISQGAHHGIYILIQPVLSVSTSKPKEKICKFLNAIVKYLDDVKAPKHSKIKKFIFYLLKAYKTIFGKKGAIHCIFKCQKRLSKHESKKLSIFQLHKSDLIIPSNYLTNTKRVKFGFADFPVPADFSNYLETVFGSAWENGVGAEPRAPHLLACSTDIPYKDLLSTDVICSSKKLNTVIFKRNFIKSRIARLKRTIKGYWDILLLTKDRVDMFRMYFPHIEYLKNLNAQKHYDELDVIMQPLMELVIDYSKKGLAMSLNSDLDEIIISLLNHSGNLKTLTRFNEYKKKLKPIPESFLRASDLEASIYTLTNNTEKCK